MDEPQTTQPHPFTSRSSLQSAWLVSSQASQVSRRMNRAESHPHSRDVMIEHFILDREKVFFLNGGKVLYPQMQWHSWNLLNIPHGTTREFLKNYRGHSICIILFKMLETLWWQQRPLLTSSSATMGSGNKYLRPPWKSYFVIFLLGGNHKRLIIPISVSHSPSFNLISYAL